MLEQIECPKCGKQELKKGTMVAAAIVVQMVPENNRRSKSSPLSALYCGHCGYILETYVDHPERLEE